MIQKVLNELFNLVEADCAGIQLAWKVADDLQQKVLLVLALSMQFTSLWKSVSST
jgi:hypothetical protein